MVFLTIGAYGLADILRQAFKREPLYISAVAEPGKMGAMTTPDSIAGLERLVGDKKCVFFPTVYVFLNRNPLMIALLRRSSRDYPNRVGLIPSAPYPAINS